MKIEYENSLKINTVSDLTDFIYNESNKMTTKLRAKHSSAKFVEFTEKTLSKYIKIFDKPLYRKIKRELQIQEAIDTMPHGLFWKLFHWELWLKIKSLDEDSKSKYPAEMSEEKPVATSLVPEIVKPLSPPIIDNTDYE